MAREDPRRARGGNARGEKSRGNSRGGGGRADANRNRGQRQKKDRMYIAGFQEDNGREPARRNYQEMNTQQMETVRQQEYEDQEAALDAIHTGVVGLKNQAYAINGEVTDQNKMLDDLGDAMDGATTDLEKQTENLKKVNAKKAKVCKLYCIIIFLLILIVVIASF